MDSGYTPLLPKGPQPSDVMDRQRYSIMVALLGMLVCYLILSLVYNDAALQRSLMLWICIGGSYLYLLKNSSKQIYVPTGELGIMAAGLHLQVVLPAAIAGPVVLVPLGIGIFSSASSTGRALGWLFGTIALRYAMPSLGFEFGGPSPIPTGLFVVVTVAFSSVALVYSGRQRLRDAARDRDLAEQLEAARADEQGRLGQQRAALEQSSARLEETLAKSELALQLAAQRNEELRTQRTNEHHLVQAIRDDLRQPLRGIVSFSQLLTRRLSKLDGAEVAIPLLDFVVDGGLRMSTMLDELLTYADADTDCDLEFGRVDLSAVVESVSDDLADMLARSGTNLDIASDLPILTGQASQLGRLFQNLIANAVKFAKPGTHPHIRISWSVIDDNFCIQVEDDGLGIPASMLPKVFGLFNRAHQQRDIEGSGVGLALCRRIAIAHQLELSVESEEGVGSCFQLKGSINELNVRAADGTRIFRQKAVAI